MQRQRYHLASLDSVRLLEGDSVEPCGPVYTTTGFALFVIPVSACGTTIKEEGGYVVYEIKMSSLYAVGIGPLGSITRDSVYEKRCLSTMKPVNRDAAGRSIATKGKPSSEQTVVSSKAILMASQPPASGERLSDSEVPQSLSYSLLGVAASVVLVISVLGLSVAWRSRPPMERMIKL
ncbi:hypothetical protein AAFF_G00418250 [Aldrovandia affinis]|uniref:ZP-N domain-containing protein n=1 Tax=Aldrovandia affinis TaxID=143900 RepID=A0AAD7SAT7_9TELE|nr:hypothetical protein AAFF_G00418250 [Aldrovandia affinis]